MKIKMLIIFFIVHEDHTKSIASANSCVENCDMTPDGKSISEGI